MEFHFEDRSFNAKGLDETRGPYSHTEGQIRRCSLPKALKKMAEDEGEEMWHKPDLIKKEIFKYYPDDMAERAMDLMLFFINSKGVDLVFDYDNNTWDNKLEVKVLFFAIEEKVPPYQLVYVAKCVAFSLGMSLPEPARPRLRFPRFYPYSREELLNMITFDTLDSSLLTIQRIWVFSFDEGGQIIYLCVKSNYKWFLQMIDTFSFEVYANCYDKDGIERIQLHRYYDDASYLSDSHECKVSLSFDHAITKIDCINRIQIGVKYRFSSHPEEYVNL